LYGKLTAVVLAGAPAGPELKSKYSVAYMAEIPIGKKTMLQHVLDALRGASYVGDICVVGDIHCEGAKRLIPPSGSLLENLIAGVKGCGSSGRVLVATSDIPLLTSEAVDDFIERCGGLDVDFCYPIIPKEISERRYPGVRRTYVRMAEGTFTGGNIFILNAGFIMENADLIREVIAARKSVTRLAGLIGLRVLLRAMIAQVLWARALDLELLERTAGRILSAKVKAVQTLYPEIGADVDDIEQLEAVEKLIGGYRVNDERDSAT
jgi:hypothetical protein